MTHQVTDQIIDGDTTHQVVKQDGRYLSVISFADGDGMTVSDRPHVLVGLAHAEMINQYLVDLHDCSDAMHTPDEHVLASLSPAQLKVVMDGCDRTTRTILELSEKMVEIAREQEALVRQVMGITD